VESKLRNISSDKWVQEHFLGEEGFYRAALAGEVVSVFCRERVAERCLRVS